MEYTSESASHHAKFDSIVSMDADLVSLLYAYGLSWMTL